jgi:hypothetical protein
MLGAIPCADTHQGICAAPSQLRVTHHLTQFSVQEDRRMRPIDPFMRGWKKEGQQLRKGVLQNRLPGVVEIVKRRSGHGP